MASFNVYKETTLPGTLQPNSIYLIAPTADQNYVEVYVTGKTADVVRRTINKADVQLMIDTSPNTSNNLIIVATIAERDALTLTQNTFVLVTDASADPTVDVGAALYVWNEDTSTYTKIAEYESMDATIAWNDIQGKPTSSPTAIDNAVANSHTHTNKTQLDKIGQDGGGNLTYGGTSVKIAWDSAQW